MISEDAANTNYIAIGLIRFGSNPRSTTIDASMLTVTPPMKLRTVINIVMMLKDNKRQQFDLCFITTTLFSTKIARLQITIL